MRLVIVDDACLQESPIDLIASFKQELITSKYLPQNLDSFPGVMSVCTGEAVRSPMFLKHAQIVVCHCLARHGDNGIPIDERLVSAIRQSHFQGRCCRVVQDIRLFTGEYEGRADFQDIPGRAGRADEHAAGAHFIDHP